MFILYSANLMNSYINSSSFLVESLEISTYSILSYSNNDTFSFSFPIWMPYISSSLMIAEARISSTMLNKSGESKHPCLVPDLWRNTFGPFSLSMVLAVGLPYMVFIMLRYVPSVPTLLRVFIIMGA